MSKRLTDQARNFESGWTFSGLRSASLFFRNAHLISLAGALLVLEEGSMSGDVREFVDARSEEPTVHITAGTLWPTSRMHWMPLAPATLVGLAGLSKNHAESEICDHIYVVNDRRLILIWHDAFDQSLLVSADVPTQAVEAFGRAVRIQPAPWQAG